jgi:ADP-ribose pyrophosphatase YjhB (NUDIX family)
MSGMSKQWKPNVTVAAVIERDGRYLMVEEQGEDGLRYNQPAGHLEAGESLVAAVIRETLEETAHDFEPHGLLGVYQVASSARDGSRVNYLRFGFTGIVGAAHEGRALDHGIVRALWLTYDEIVALSARHRSPLVLQCVEDHRARRAPTALDHLFCHPSVAVGS